MSENIEWHDNNEMVRKLDVVEAVLVCDDLEDVVDCIMNVPIVETKQVWIPCSERLPEAQRDVLFCTKSKVYEGWYSFRSGWETKAEFVVEDVLAWMELPTPWKGESDG